MPIITPTDVEVTERPDGSISVHPIWSNVDRVNGSGWLVGNMRMADRLRRALLAGVVYSATEIMTDVNGKTLVHGTSKILARHMNADLRKLGY
jgi:hypothetical protein